MSWIDNVGIVIEDFQRSAVIWFIPASELLPDRMGTEFWSPVFTSCGGNQCQLTIFPNGCRTGNTEGWMGIKCWIPAVPPNASVQCCIVNGLGFEVLNTEMERSSHWHHKYKWIQRAEFDARSEELFSGGFLSVVCRVVSPYDSSESSDAEIEEESDVEDDVVCVGEHENCESREQPKEDSLCHGFHNLSNNLKDLYIKSKDTDFIIRVKGREFHVHKLLLKARIPAFDAMLTHDMAERNEGVATIDDCDPDVFDKFLLFVYCGSVEHFSPENICGLFMLADKYSLLDLRAMCLDFMKDSLSIEIIFDVISLATIHGEVELLERAIVLFRKNAKELLMSAKWRQFLEENPTVGNKLFLKVVKNVVYSA